MHGTLPTPPRRHGSALPLVLRLALRELRGGFRGFGTFLACIALGVAAIAGVSSISRSLTEGLTREGRKILGGDMAFSLVHREASEAERAFLAARRGAALRARRGLRRRRGPDPPLTPRPQARRARHPRRRDGRAPGEPRLGA